jgi:ABC-type phosphate/phosphonate transport system substrate-binding protein
MKSWSIIFLIVFILLPGHSLQAGGGGLNMGYTLKSITDIDIKDAATAFNMLAQELGKAEGINTNTNVYENLNPLIQDFKDKKLDLVIMKSVDYLRAKNQIESELAFVQVIGNKKTNKYLILVRAEEHISNLVDLKKKNIAVYKGDETGMLFLEVMLQRQKLDAPESFFLSIDKKMKPSQAILSVFFGQADICITNEKYYKTMAELNPQITKKLKVLAASPEMIDTLALFRKDYSQNCKELIREKGLQLATYPRGKQILTLLKIDGITTVRESELDSLKKIYFEHEQVKKKI